MYFLRLEGIRGDSEVANYEDWIRIESFQGGIQAPVVAPGEPASEAELADFNFTKNVDRSSPSLFQACAEQRVFDDVVLDMCTVRDGEALPVISYRLAGCRITSIFPSGHDQGDGFTNLFEQMTLNAESVEWRYTPYDHEGMPGDAAKARFAARVSKSSSGVRKATQDFIQFVPNTAFIMMWMDPEVDELVDIHTAIADTCRGFGIVAQRADDLQHDERITDVILRQIEESEFLIADLTGVRPNVYYEVGYAHAVGKRPILYRKKGTALHFDLAVHNVREYRNITELRDLLSQRLEALVGRSNERTPP